MPLRNSINRILIIGQETGPFAKQIKKLYPDMKIGSVDILGNLDTRNSIESAFSVVKQTPGESLERKKVRSDLDLLYELTLIMLDEIEFDILIPLTPFNSNPEYLRSLSDKIMLPIVDWKTLEKTSSPWEFLSHLIETDPTSSPRQRLIESEELLKKKGEEGLFVTKKENFYINKDFFSADSSIIPQDGFFLPIKEIHCAAFYSTSESISNIGVQTIKPAANHPFFYDEFEKNAYIPFSSTKRLPIDEVIESLVSIVERSQLMGFLTIYFGINEKNLVPISCNSMPDEKIDLWITITRNNLIPLLINPSENNFQPTSRMVFGYKYPIFTSHPILVPMIPEAIAEQRNLPGVYNTVDYPVCAIQSFSKDVKDLSRRLEIDMKRIHKILGQF
jgi:hypothetical protein